MSPQLMFPNSPIGGMNAGGSSDSSSSILYRISKASILMIKSAGLTVIFLCSVAIYLSANKDSLMHTGDVSAMCSRDPSSLDRVILMGRLDAPGSLLSGTGTGHWFHLLESVLPSLMDAHQKVWSDDVLQTEILSPRDATGVGANNADSSIRGAFTNKAGTSDIFIVFPEEKGVDGLGPFGRFTLASVLTGARFRRVHLAYAKQISRYHPDNKVVMLQGFEVRFTIDFESQGVHERFMQTAPMDRPRPTAWPVQGLKCAREVLYVPLRPYQRNMGTQDWLTSPDHLSAFQDSFKRTCSIVSRDSAYATIPETSLPEHLNRVAAETTSSLTFADADDRISVSAVHPNLGVVVPQGYEPTLLVYQRDSSRKFKRIEPIMEFLETHLNGANGSSSSSTTHSFLRKTSRRALAGTRATDTALSPLGNLTGRPSDINAERNDSSVSRLLRRALSEHLNYVGVPRWNVRLVMHDETNMSPCELLQQMHSADVFLTPHGFQSVLLLYQPLHSVFAEVFPYRYFKPHLYGKLQVALQQRFGTARPLFIGRSASSELFFDNALVNWMWPTEQDCEHSFVCRHYSRFQDVTPSAAMLQELVNYLKSHYVVVASKYGNLVPNSTS